jgi:DNA-binding transcriptional ArsR family regulator/uncharacterized protein YndB with AHSA1/START domain
MIWRALADPTRRRILDLLRERPRTTGELCESFETTRFAVMKHLTVLEEAGLVVVRRRGRERWNHLNAVPLREAYQRWMQPYAEDWAESLLSLKDHVEGERGPRMGEIEVEPEVRIEAPPARVCEAITTGIGGWWSHTFFDGKVRLEPEVGGRFWEDAGDRAALYALVQAIEPPRLLRLSGPMGMTGAVVGSIAFTLDGAGDGDATVVRLSHRAYGDVDADTEASYGEGWRSLLDVELRRYLAA